MPKPCFARSQSFHLRGWACYCWANVISIFMLVKHIKMYIVFVSNLYIQSTSRSFRATQSLATGHWAWSWIAIADPSSVHMKPCVNEEIGSFIYFVQHVYVLSAYWYVHWGKCQFLWELTWSRGLGDVLDLLQRRKGWPREVRRVLRSSVKLGSELDC